MNYSIIYSDRAELNLLEIQYYISDYSNQVAEKFSRLLLGKIETELSVTPHMYREYYPGIRIIPHKGYVILYQVDENKSEVEIIAVVHGARDLNNLGIIRK